ncbi:MAG TPA: CPBP family intramembrane glutamic endopeptidase [Cyclobacteriaceae bacterium]
MDELKEPRISDLNPIISLFLIFFMILLVSYGVLGQWVGLELSSLFYDGDLKTEILKEHPDPHVLVPVLIMLGTSTLIGLILSPLFYVRIIERKPWSPFFKNETNWLKVLGIIPMLGICFYIAISPIVEWNMNFQFSGAAEEFGTWAREMEDQLMGLTQLITKFDSPAEYALGLVVIALLPGIGEELVFRGMIQNELKRASNNIHVAIWTSAFLFSAIHMQFFGFVPRMLLGAMFGYLYYWSGNLFIPMIAHIFHNGFTVTMIYLYNQGSTDINIDSEESAPLFLVAICGVVTFALLYFFRKHYSSEQSLP